MTPSHQSLYLNRELSWLAFNERVLHEAGDPRVPLLERAKFLAIFSSNLDEFFMVRVAGLRRQAAAGVAAQTPDGLSVTEQLHAIRDRVRDLLRERAGCLTTLLHELSAQGIRILGMADLAPAERHALDEYFEAEVFPVLTPLAVDPGHPFPYVSNLSLSLAVEICDPETDSRHFARVKVPQRLPRWVPVPGRPLHYVPIEQLLGDNLEALFSGMVIVAWHAFRVTRYSDLEFTDLEDPGDLLETIEARVFERRFGEVIRLEVQDTMPPHVRERLLDALRDADYPAPTSLDVDDIEDAGELLALTDLLALGQLDLPTLRDAPFVAKVPESLRDPARSIFDVRLANGSQNGPTPRNH